MLNDDNPYRSPLSHGERPLWSDCWLICLGVVFHVLLATSIGWVILMFVLGVAVVSKAASFQTCDPYFDTATAVTFSAAVANLIVLAIGALLEYRRIDPPLREGP